MTSALPLTPRGRRLAVAALRAAVAVGLLAALTGCTAGRTDADAAKLAEWAAGQSHVLSAEGGAFGEFDTSVSIRVVVDPAVTDDELRDLAERIDGEVAGSAWSETYATYLLGEHQSFSNLGGEVTREVFIGVRHDDRYSAVSARGDGGGANYSVRLQGPEGLHQAADHLAELARTAGGVQSNLTFAASSDDGRWTVTRTYEQPADAAAAELDTVRARFDIDTGWALALETGDQQLVLTVPDAATQAAVESFGAGQTAVDYQVSITAVPDPTSPARPVLPPEGPTPAP